MENSSTQMDSQIPNALFSFVIYVYGSVCMSIVMMIHCASFNLFEPPSTQVVP